MAVNSPLFYRLNYARIATRILYPILAVVKHFLHLVWAASAVFVCLTHAQRKLGVLVPTQIACIRQKTGRWSSVLSVSDKYF